MLLLMLYWEAAFCLSMVIPHDFTLHCAPESSTQSCFREGQTAAVYLFSCLHAQTVVLAIGSAPCLPHRSSSRHLIKRGLLGIRMQVAQSCGFLRHSWLHGGHVHCQHWPHAATRKPHWNVSSPPPRPHFSRPTVIFVAPSSHDDKLALTFILVEIFFRIGFTSCLPEWKSVDV